VAKRPGPVVARDRPTALWGARTIGGRAVRLPGVILVLDAGVTVRDVQIAARHADP
jgi:hypothetical protein